MKNIDVIKSVGYDEQQIIKDILRLHCKGKDIELDPTYSKGNFYKKGLKQPIYRFDLAPQVEGVALADVRNLPLLNNSIDVVMFDPPFLATTGRSLKGEADGNNVIGRRFGVYPSEEALFKMYESAIAELHRVMKKGGGVLIFKCQDKVSSGKQYMSHCIVYRMAVEQGFYPKDLFILLAKNRIIAKWQADNQKHARKYHSYFWVFRK